MLEAAGVDTVKELETRRPETLLDKIVAVNSKTRLVRRPPTARAVQSWIAQAKKLQPVLTH